jgi:hypothetical protein
MRCFSGKYCSIAISAVGLTPVLAAAFATIFSPEIRDFLLFSGLQFFLFFNFLLNQQKNQSCDGSPGCKQWGIFAIPLVITELLKIKYFHLLIRFFLPDFPDFQHSSG